jgi:hypothetical protein
MKSASTFLDTAWWFVSGDLAVATTRPGRGSRARASEQ